MKKLMFTAAAAAVTAGAFAVPTVYDYKASVKHLYLKEVPVSYKEVNARTGLSENKKAVVYQKYQKTTSLKGYLIMDQDGATSPTINTLEGWYDTQLDYTADGTAMGGGTDYGRNRGFLVVINPRAYKTVRHPKILPAILDAKWLDTNFSKGGAALNGLAEGTLYVGGDAVAPVRPQIDALGDDLTLTTRKVAPRVPVANTKVTYTVEDGNTIADRGGLPVPGMVAIADYVWTSIYLFSGTTEKDAYFNGPNWFYRTYGNVKNSPFGVFEYAWDQNLPPTLQTGWFKYDDQGEGKYYNRYTNIDANFTVNYFHDTWMNGAGVGKWFTKNNEGHHEYCCGIVDYEEDHRDPRTLESLSGNLKGGLFLCTENGIIAGSTTYAWFRNIEWEDQFNTARITPAEFFAADVWQNDLWQDGFIEQETTDVIYGTWSIKYNKKLLVRKDGPQDLPEVDGKSFVDKYFPDGTQDNPSARTLDTKQRSLWRALYVAAWDLDKNVNLYDGTEIHNKTIANRAKLPMITPQFAEYYRLFRFHKVN